MKNKDANKKSCCGESGPSQCCSIFVTLLRKLAEVLDGKCCSKSE